MPRGNERLGEFDAAAVERHEGDEREECPRVVAPSGPRAGGDDRRAPGGVQEFVPREPTGRRRARAGQKCRDGERDGDSEGDEDATASS